MKMKKIILMAMVLISSGVWACDEHASAKSSDKKISNGSKGKQDQKLAMCSKDDKANSDCGCGHKGHKGEDLDSKSESKAN